MQACAAFGFDFSGVSAFSLGVGLRTEAFERGEVCGGGAGEVGEALCETVSGDEDRELGDGVLAEELFDEGGCGCEEEAEAGWFEVGFEDGVTEVEEEDYVPDDSSLEWGRVFENAVKARLRLVCVEY